MKLTLGIFTSFFVFVNAQFNLFGRFNCRGNGYRQVNGVCTDIDECLENAEPCRPRHKCVNTRGSYICIEEGFVDPCIKNPCGRNAICRRNGNSRTCTCSPGYFGDPESGCYTSSPADPCQPNPCGSNTVCRNSGGRPICSCRPGYSGDPFSGCFAPAPDPCQPSPCGRNTVCRSSGGRPICSCLPGYVGDPFTGCTEAAVNPCQPSPCGTNTICRNSGGRAVCSCKSGYIGNPLSGCSAVSTNPCQPSPCGRNTICKNSRGRSVCSCSPGYVGDPLRGCTRITTPPSVTTTASGRCTKRTWSKCSGIPPTRRTMDSCPERTEVCSEGQILGSTFIENVLMPSMEASTPSTSKRQFNKFDNTKEDNKTAKCEPRYLRNAQGEIILGTCVKPGQSRGFGRRPSRQKRQIVEQTKRDLLIMMDESGSIGFRRFEKVKRIAAAIVRLLCDAIRVHPRYTRVSIVSFDYTYKLHIKLRTPERHLQFLDNDSEQLANYIARNIFYNHFTSQQTCLLEALQHAYNHALDASNGGRRGQANVEQDIIIISDGCENCYKVYLTQQEIRARIISQSNFFIRQGIHVYVIGIGLRERCKETLSLLAQGGRCFHFFYLTQWDYEVDDFLGQLENPPDDVCLNVFESPLMQCLDPI